MRLLIALDRHWLRIRPKLVHRAEQLEDWILDRIWYRRS